MYSFFQVYILAYRHAPQNLMIKNDFAIHLMKNERKMDAVHELKKALLNNSENAMLYKNYASILAKSGFQFTIAILLIAHCII